MWMDGSIPSSKSRSVLQLEQSTSVPGKAGLSDNRRHGTVTGERVVPLRRPSEWLRWVTPLRTGENSWLFPSRGRGCGGVGYPLVWNDVGVFVCEEAFQSHLLDSLVLMAEQLRRRWHRKTLDSVWFRSPLCDVTNGRVFLFRRTETHLKWVFWSAALIVWRIRVLPGCRAREGCPPCRGIEDWWI